MLSFLSHTAHLILFVELLAFVYWAAVTAMTGMREADALLEVMIAAFHFPATFALYTGLAEIKRACEKFNSGKCEQVHVSLARIWIAVAFVSLVTDIGGLLLTLRGHNIHDKQLHTMVLVMNIIFLVLVVVEIIWLVLLRLNIEPEAPAVRKGNKKQRSSPPASSKRSHEPFDA